MNKYHIEAELSQEELQKVLEAVDKNTVVKVTVKKDD